MDIDHAKREIYMPIAGAVDPVTGAAAAPEALLLVDFDNSNVGEQAVLAAQALCTQSMCVAKILINIEL